MQVGESRGFAFVAVLVLLAVCAVGLAVAGPLWRDQVRRERESDLLRIGRLYAEGIASYTHRSPGSTNQPPERLEDLIEDRRFVRTVRHLRELYPDPLHPDRPWGLVRDEAGRVVGVYSLSEEEPFARTPQALGSVKLPAAQRYSEWKFVVGPHK